MEMINILLSRILILFLVIYVIHFIAQRTKASFRRKQEETDAHKREYTKYDQDEWEKIKKSLGEK